MSSSVKWRGLLVLACIFTAVFCLGPTLMKDDTPGWWSNIVGPINLGLDLQGGLHLVLGVDAEKAVEARVDSMVDQAESLLREKDIVYKRIDRRDSDRLAVVVYDEDAGKAVDALMAENFANIEPETIPAQGGYIEKHYKLTAQEVKNIKQYAVRQALETLRNRVDQFGVSEPTLQRQGEDRILIQLPGIDDPDRAIKLIGTTARLEFKMVAENVNPEDARKGQLPQGTQLLFERSVNRATGTVVERPLVVYSKTVLTGDLLADAQVRIDTRFNEPYVSIDFNNIGAKRFEQITAANTGKRMAIILDDTVYSAPVIREKIAGGKAMISGSFNEQEATDLAIVLRAGSLPAPVKILENRTVGASLGKDSINRGILSIIIGSILVVLAMAVYYKKAGLVAVLALLLNVLFISALLALFGATLTLPGMAGIVLTIGMAVDANVLIFERIREELRLGKTPRLALDAGFSKAFLTIVDANVTTLIAALVLFQFGTGPVKGFAVTLSIGIVSSLFTAVFISRVVFDLIQQIRPIKRLSI